MKKEFLRKTYKEKRDNIKNKDIKDNEIYKKVINNQNVLSAKIILIYISIKSEVDTSEIIKHFINSKKIAIPKIINNNMKFCLCYKECLVEKIDTDKFDYKIDEVITD